jgi:hypothetical protein
MAMEGLGLAVAAAQKRTHTNIPAPTTHAADSVTDTGTTAVFAQLVCGECTHTAKPKHCIAHVAECPLSHCRTAVGESDSGPLEGLPLGADVSVDGIVTQASPSGASLPTSSL